MDLRAVKFEGWGGDWKARIAVLGLSSTGFSVADTLIELGARVKVFAKHASDENIELLEVIGGELEDSDTRVSAMDEFDPELVVISPGFTPSHPMIEHLRNRQIPIWTDIDLAWKLRDRQPKCNWITITGTNGKTTTVEMVTHILNSSGKKAVACGNIGNPILNPLREPVEFDFFVVELSSFQLHYIDEISPISSAFLNIADDHLDWHQGFDNYLQAKAKIYENTQVAAVYNVEDKNTLTSLEQAEVVEGCRAIGFTLGMPSVSMVGYVEEVLADRAFLEQRADNALEIATHEDLEQIAPISMQLLQNVAAASALCRSVGVSPAEIKSGIRSFSQSEHRNQFLGEVAGVRFINDSKATNSHATIAAMASLENVVWIAGGDFKGVDPSALVEKIHPQIKACVVIGKDPSPIVEAISKHAPNLLLEVITEQDQPMTAAVRKAWSLADSGDTVLLSPAAASLDQFASYQKRGEAFIEAVEGLEKP